MNNILLLTYPLNGILMIGMPIALAIFLTRRFKYSWRVVGVGAVTFIVSQVGHIPFNWFMNNLFTSGRLPPPPEQLRLVFFSIFWGLSAGVWEEVARYGAYRWFAKEARSWGRGLLYGTGHGGIEAILLGLIVLANFTILAAMRGQDVRLLIPSGQSTPENVTLAQAQIEVYWSQPWTLSLLGAVERFFTIPLHLACSLLVMQVFTRKQLRWLWFAISWHTLANATVVFLARGPWIDKTWGYYAIEGVIGLFALASLGILFALRQPEPQPEPPPELEPILPVSIPTVEIKPEDLDKTRYT